MAEEHIKQLARACALGNIPLRDARCLFDSMYAADAVMLEGGRMTRAADRAGIRPEHFRRIRWGVRRDYSDG